MPTGIIDPTCALHGMKWSKHEYGRCFYCCLCFIDLDAESCNKLEDGSWEDVCQPCAVEEAKRMAEIKAWGGKRVTLEVE